MAYFGGTFGTYYGDHDTVARTRAPDWMMDRVKAAAPLKGFVSFDEDADTDAQTETISGTEVPPHLLEEHAE